MNIIAALPPVSKWPAVPIPCLMFVAHPTSDVERIAEASVKGGVNIVRLRKDPSGLTEWTEELTESLALRLRGRAVLITCASDIGATPVVGDGLHLREADDRRRSEFDVPSLDGRLIGRSVHSVDAAREAVERGADYLLAGTIYDTSTHPDVAGRGVDHLQAICSAVEIPVIAIGGITPDRAGECLAAGASGVAVMSTIASAAKPRKVAAEYRDAIELAWRRIYHV